MIGVSDELNASGGMIPLCSSIDVEELEEVSPDRDCDSSASSSPLIRFSLCG